MIRDSYEARTDCSNTVTVLGEEAGDGGGPFLNGERRFVMVVSQTYEGR